MEFVHDVLVAEQMPFDEPIDPKAYRDRAALDSAVNRPFQTFDGVDLHPSIVHKAAALFHSLACNHCFLNGNKRTAVMGIDMFLTANGVFLLISNDDMYALAKQTVEANQRGEPLDHSLDRLATRIAAESISFEDFAEFVANAEYAQFKDVYEGLLADRVFVRTHPLNARSNIWSR